MARLSPFAGVSRHGAGPRSATLRGATLRSATFLSLSAALLGAALLGVGHTFIVPGGPGTTDFVQYWSAAEALRRGQNPYDPAVLLSIQAPLVSLTEVIRLWNPPLIVPLISWLPALTFKAAAVVWFALGGLLITLACRMVLGLGPRLSLLVVMPVLLTFYPFIDSLQYGQVAPLLLLGLSGFLVLLPTRPFSAGVALSLTLLKPHLLALIYVVSAVQAIRARDLRAVGGFAAGALVLGIGAELLAPGIFTLYLSALAEPPVYFQTPTAASWLQWALPGNPSWPRLSLPIGAALLTTLIAARAPLRPLTTILPVLLPLSLLAAPYGWTYDQMLLLPALFIILHRWGHRGTLVLLAAHLIALYRPDGIPMQYFVWYPLLILGLGLFTLIRGRTASPSLQSGPG